MAIFRRRSRDDDRSATAPSPQAGAAPPQVIELNAAELGWLDELRSNLPGGGVGMPPEAIGRLVDQLLDAWWATPEPERTDPNIVINTIGVALGDALCARVPEARWAAVSDEAGTELAVVTAQVDGPTVLPMNAVAKRWVDREREWVAPFVEWVTARMVELSAEPSEQVHQLAAFALEHAVRSIVPDGGPLIPFALVETADGRSLHRFVGELSEGVARAREHVRTSGGLRVAVAWDGYLTVGGQRDDALFVEASEPGEPSVLMARRYRETPDGTEAIGEPLTVDRGSPLL